MPCSGHSPVHTEEGAPFELLIGFDLEGNWHHSASIALRRWRLARLPKVGVVELSACEIRVRQVGVQENSSLQERQSQVHLPKIHVIQSRAA